jgi:hypothetical protein
MPTTQARAAAASRKPTPVETSRSIVEALYALVAEVRAMRRALVLREQKTRPSRQTRMNKTQIYDRRQAIPVLLYRCCTSVSEGPGADPLRPKFVFKIMEPTGRFELPACCLRNSCSTPELRRHRRRG